MTPQKMTLGATVEFLLTFGENGIYGIQMCNVHVLEMLLSTSLGFFQNVKSISENSLCQ